MLFCLLCRLIRISLLGRWRKARFDHKNEGSNVLKTVTEEGSDNTERREVKKN